MRSLLAPPTSLAAVIVAAALALGDPTDAVALESSLPIVVLDAETAIPEDGKVRSRLRIIDGGELPSTTAGEANVYDDHAGVELRGQRSRTFPKRSLSVELRDAAGDEREAGLLGMPADDDWVLYAAYGDASRLRNVVGYDLARWTGAWSPRTRFVELVLDGSHRGLYVLTERPELNGRRLPGAGRGHALLEMTVPEQARRKGPHFQSTAGARAYVYADPDPRDLPGARRRAIRRLVGAAERALYRGRGWRRHLDRRATVDYVLLQELFKNPDAFKASTFMTATRRELRLGPVWDLDLAMGASRDRGRASPHGWIGRRQMWASRLHRDAAFMHDLARRWSQLRGRGIGAAMRRSLARGRTTIAPVVGRDEALWPQPGRGHAADAERLERWLAQRMRWMDRALRTSR